MTVLVLVGCHDSRAAAALALRRLLPRVVALSLHIKHVEWNLTGSSAVATGRAIAEIGTAVTGWADDVAALTIALGHPVDGRPSVAAGLSAAFRPDRVTGSEAIDLLGGHIRSTGAAVRRELRVLADAHALTSQLLSSLLEDLQRCSWVLRTSGD